MSRRLPATTAGRALIAVLAAYGVGSMCAEYLAYRNAKAKGIRYGR